MTGVELLYRLRRQIKIKLQQMSFSEADTSAAILAVALHRQQPHVVYPLQSMYDLTTCSLPHPTMPPLHMNPLGLREGSLARKHTAGTLKSKHPESRPLPAALGLLGKGLPPCPCGSGFLCCWVLTGPLMALPSQTRVADGVLCETVLVPGDGQSSVPSIMPELCAKPREGLGMHSLRSSEQPPHAPPPFFIEQCFPFFRRPCPLYC